jgi:precorrin-2/cobalt-factor-2 C20-methyltransferase
MSGFDAGARLEAGSVVLRPFGPGDADAVTAAIAAGEEFLPANGPVDAGGVAHWLSHSVREIQVSGWGVHFAVADRRTGELAGSIGLFRADWTAGSAEVGYGVRPAWRGRGVATEALGLVARWALGECGLHRVELRADTANLASIRVAEKAGFHREGVLRGVEADRDGHHDQVLFSLIAPDLAPSPPAGPHLIGVGVGPGDPELVTVKALRALRDADLVLAPVMTPDEQGRAEAVAAFHGIAVTRVVFALNDRGGVTEKRAAAWDRAGGTVAEAFAAGARTVAFVTIGDPNVYSTFTYLAQTVRTLVPEVVVETVPGITAMQDLAARSATVLAEGTESVALLPLTAGMEAFRRALESSDTVVAYKFGGDRGAAGRSHGGEKGAVGELRELLEDSGRLDGAVYGARLGLPGEDVRTARDIDGPVPYLSTLIVPGRRAGRGGKL